MVIGIDGSRAFVEEKTGTETYSFQVIKHMVELDLAKGHEIVLFTRGVGEDELTLKHKFLRRKNVRIIEIKLPFLWTQVGLAYYTWASGIDVLWVPAHTLPVLRRPGLKTVVTVHGLEYKWLPEYDSLLQRWYLPLSTWYAAHFSSRVIAVSEFTKSQFVSDFGVSGDKIGVIHEGADLSFFSKKRAKPRIRAVLSKYDIRGDYLLFVGSLQPRKNLEFLISVYSRLRKKHPGLKLVLVGSEGWKYESIYRKVRELGVENGVFTPGRVGDEELASFMQGAKLYVQPSYTEGFGLPVLEAMASQLPVVSSSGGALPEVVSDAGLVLAGSEEGGFDEKIWAREIGKLLKNSNQRTKYKKMGLERVSQFSWDKCSKDVFDVIVNL